MREQNKKVKGWVLQFITAFGLTLSVTVGFFLGYLAGKSFGGETYMGVVGALVGFVLGLAYLIWLATGNGNGIKQ
mgnify:CR=1 FL=1